MNNIKNYLKKNLYPWTKAKIKSLYKDKTTSISQFENNDKPKVYLLDLPAHGNLGDEAIAVSEYAFLKKYCKKYGYDLMLFNIGEFIPNLWWYKKNIKKNDIIVCHGGGNIGDEYDFFEDVRRTIIHEFKKNRIIVFPQTYYFNSTEEAKKSEVFGRRVYNNNDNLVIFAREKYSYDKMKRNFYNCQVFLTPDMVFNYPYTKKKDESSKTNKVLFCMRDDVEASLSEKDIKKLEAFFTEQGYDVQYTDTATEEEFGSDITRAQKAVDAKIQEFSIADFVLTDRLHGMVLTALSGTNCIVFSNYNYKVKGVYQWLKEYEGIHFYKNSENILDVIEGLKSKSYRYSHEQYSKYFDRMAKTIFEKDVNNK
ncbi:polysaccharide pyruvyl transferase family protein [Lactobacillus gallinarum]|uniref:polysaccharide pyruvyl transferase family protein n=1 Tax=Lactobacillus gallinarum TaxID=52242 RepID=UPI001958122E|nr:polysaccharide pyruvyl transferase family protein [Lactobacillus gallinarum]